MFHTILAYLSDFYLIFLIQTNDPLSRALKPSNVESPELDTCCFQHQYTDFRQTRLGTPKFNFKSN